MFLKNNYKTFNKHKKAKEQNPRENPKPKTSAEKVQKPLEGKGFRKWYKDLRFIAQHA